jgi:glycosyltransferase involved in cell wall biosynthesis
MPVHNSMPYLKPAIESILQQTIAAEVQIFILNDHSTDESIGFIKNLNESKIKIFNPAGSGLVEMLNFGLEKADTEFIARMDSDDISLPERFEKQLNILKQYEDISLVGTRGFYIGQKQTEKKIPINCPEKHNDIIKAMLKRRYAIIHPTILFRKELIDSVGLYNKDYFPSEDYELFFRIGQKNKFANLPEYQYLVRIRKHSITSNQIENSLKKYEEARRKYYHFYTNKNPGVFNKISYSFDLISINNYRKGLSFYLNGEIFKAYLFFAISILLNPMRLFEKLFRTFSI